MESWIPRGPFRDRGMAKSPESSGMHLGLSFSGISNLLG